MTYYVYVTLAVIFAVSVVHTRLAFVHQTAFERVISFVVALSGYTVIAKSLGWL